jgi:hypothetical protein
LGLAVVKSIEFEPKDHSLVDIIGKVATLRLQLRDCGVCAWAAALKVGGMLPLHLLAPLDVALIGDYAQARTLVVCLEGLVIGVEWRIRRHFCDVCLKPDDVSVRAVDVVKQSLKGCNCWRRGLIASPCAACLLSLSVVIAPGIVAHCGDVSGAV